MCTARPIGQALERRCADGERLLFKTALNEKVLGGEEKGFESCCGL